MRIRELQIEVECEECHYVARVWTRPGDYATQSTCSHLGGEVKAIRVEAFATSPMFPNAVTIVVGKAS